MKQKKMNDQLFFSKTNDFLNRYLPEQIVRSKHTIKSYRDSLTVFRRYVTEQKKISLKRTIRIQFMMQDQNALTYIIIQKI